MPIEKSRLLALLVLLLFGAIAAALFNPLALPVEIELALPVVVGVWVGSLLCVRWYRHRQQSSDP
jgi:uncharacterized membrane-anchored protein